MPVSGRDAAPDVRERSADAPSPIRPDPQSATDARTANRIRSAPGGDDDRHDPRVVRAWRLLGASIAMLLVLALGRALADGGLVDWVVTIAAVAAAGAALATWHVVESREVGRRAESDSFQRILSGLSRSVSPDAIVSAIVEELGSGTGADHIVVARRRPGSRLLEATLVATHSGLPVSRTILPVTDLEDPLTDERAVRAAIAAGRGRRLAAIPVDDGGRGGTIAERPLDEILAATPQRGTGVAGREPHAVPVRSGAPDRIARRVADRVRDLYGLKHTLAAPLRIDGRVEGAIVLSRRTPVPWPARTRRLLGAAAVEASAALARVYSHRAAEARASTDALTGLPNRRYFDEYVGLLARRRRADDRVGVLMIDIDRFKHLNDTYGHAVGDHVLRAVAGAIGRTVREDDVPARYGGEEFVVLLRNPSEEVAAEVAERVRRAVGALDLSELGVPGVSVSVGVAVAADPDMPMEELIADADRALYRAKRMGRDRVVAA